MDSSDKYQIVSSVARAEDVLKSEAAPHVTESHAATPHVSGSHAATDHVSGSHAASDHVSGSHAASDHVSESHAATPHVSESLALVARSSSYKPTSLILPVPGSSSSAVARAGQLVVMPRIQNIVVTVNFSCAIDLRTVATSLRNAEYNPRTFSGCIFRMLRPRTTALIFESGKAVVVGAKTEQDAHLSTCILAKCLQRLGFSVKFREFRVRNMVAIVDLKFPINLEQLSNAHFSFCTYEPEIFPGLVYKLLQPRTTILIFVSGKVVVVGAKSRMDILKAVENIYPLLRKYRK